jgi:hypothetical protein
MRADGITSGVIGLALDKKAFIDEPAAKDLCPGGKGRVQPGYFVKLFLRVQKYLPGENKAFTNGVSCASRLTHQMVR